MGRKRLFGAKRAGILSIPCVVLDIGEEEKLLMLLADARDQKEINVLEMAFVCKKLEDDFDYPRVMLADLSHQSRSQITNILRVLKLPRSLQKELAKGNLSYGHAKAIAALPNEEMVEAGERVLKEHLSVHQLEEYLRERKFAKENPVDTLSLNQDVEVSVSDKEILIRFSSEEDKKRILDALKHITK